ncbi:ABC transporter ATP-binding protein [Paenibacillus massiliensis]|uniref:ABC transporter ATP-binding protein n=1 Tax=Paenibacillus massiliensis TaxID=225917 RepID=UPI00048C192F|nr:ABC transporter ATP-binding protein [Paenibacillus massiliensis]
MSQPTEHKASDNRAQAGLPPAQRMFVPGRGSGGGPGPGQGPVPVVRAENSMATLKRIWTYLGRQRAGLFMVYAATLLGALATLAGPYFIGRAIDDYIIPRDYYGLVRICLLILGVYLLSSALTWIQAYVMSSVSQGTVKELRRDLFAKYHLLPVRFFDTRSNGELMSRATNDIENISNSLNQSVTQLLNSVITLIGSLVIMLLLNVPLTAVALLSIPLVLLVTRQITRATRKYFKEQQRHLGELNGYIEEIVGGQKVVKQYGREQDEITRFRTISQQVNRVGKRAQIYSGMVGPVMNLVNNFTFALIAAIGGWMAFHDWTTVGVIVSFLNYSKQFGRPVTELANQYNLIQSAVAGAERVFEIMDMKTEYDERQTEREEHHDSHQDQDRVIQHASRPSHALAQTREQVQLTSSSKLRGDVVFSKVCFSYSADNPILTDVSFEAKAGQKIALVGPTGAGKTTIVNLLTRFYDIDSGSIRIDDIPIDEMDKNSLRRQLGMVLQDAHVFSGSIRENIRFGRLNASDDEVVQAARLANADAFISRLPDGYDTDLGVAGGNLSQGQRQLLTIARAILADPAILILDEATSSVDTRTEMYIQDAMKTLMEGRTSFVIAHRLSTIQDADLILVMKDGRVAQQGTHQDLLERKGFYASLYTSQFTNVS